MTNFNPLIFSNFHQRGRQCHQQTVSAEKSQNNVNIATDKLSGSENDQIATVYNETDTSYKSYTK